MIFIAIYCFFKFVSQLASQSVAQILERQLRKKAFDQLVNADQAFISSKRTG